MHQKLKNIVQQRCRGHYTANKYELLRVTQGYNTRVQVQKVTRVKPTAHHIELLVENLQ